MTTPNNTQTKFTSFSTSIDHIALPKYFTFPYYYQPHALAHIAMNELQSYLSSQTEWSHDFDSQGKMFAVLVVKTKDGKLGYLSSYAGNDKTPQFFVDSIIPSSKQDKILNLLRQELATVKQTLVALETATELNQLKSDLLEKQRASQLEISQFQAEMKDGKKRRKEERSKAEEQFSLESDRERLAAVVRTLGDQSSSEKRTFKALKTKWQQTISELLGKITQSEAEIQDKRDEYQRLDLSLKVEEQRSILLLNQSGQSKSLFELFFQKDGNHEPIAGSIDQNLPKLLQAAYQLSLKPIALGEFWWGSSPYDQIRQHKNLYPVCQSKCYEILDHMLEGIETDESPLEITPSLNKELDIVYEDNVLVVVNKPAEFLSVSGKYINDSVHARMAKRYPHATGPLVVHRLDMSTSGLLVFTLTAETNKHVQQQFIERSVEKRYTALLEGTIERRQGIIDLPLAGDMEDRPRQMVSHERGRNAETRFEVLSVENNRTKVHLYPKTGRTHQLRVHCAHQAGLNTPIVGDDLYGFKDSRLHLHAGYLKLRHPITEQEMAFEVPSDF
ncbi:pseudouridine synthase [Vibrio sp. ZSDE26]|uniref:Pseudouridine synthase n=1 Tax=Vibrio amylolyticus TaxID=2847292 RepID=A0A9X1XL46_9VIBR|nr:RluA family pseudouridine synthase [Vibrio amylolyticus]MCK6263728.1 pseudouridine synthase [Vibrio amylolyticus]